MHMYQANPSNVWLAIRVATCAACGHVDNLPAAFNPDIDKCSSCGTLALIEVVEYHQPHDLPHVIDQLWLQSIKNDDRLDNQSPQP